MLPRAQPRRAPTTSRTTAAPSASTTTSSRRLLTTRTSSTRAAGSTTASARAACSAPTTAAMTWRDLGYDQHPDFQVFAFDPNDSNKIVYGSDGGVWYSLNRGGRLAAGRSAQRGQLAEPERPVDPADRRRDRPDGLQLGQFTSIATVPTVPAPRSGAARRTTARCASRAALTAVVRHPERRRRPGARRPDRRRAVRVRRAGPELLRLRHVLQHLAVPDGRRRSVLLQQQRDHERDQPARSVDFYIPFAMNKDNPSQLFLGHVSALSHEQREDAELPATSTGTTSAPT